MDKRKLILTNFIGSNDSLLDLNFINVNAKDSRSELSINESDLKIDCSTVEDVSITENSTSWKSETESVSSSGDHAWSEISTLEQTTESERHLGVENQLTDHDRTSVDNLISKTDVNCSISKTDLHCEFVVQESKSVCLLERLNSSDNLKPKNVKLKHTVSFSDTYRKLSDMNLKDQNKSIDECARRSKLREYVSDSRICDKSSDRTGLNDTTVELNSRITETKSDNILDLNSNRNSPLPVQDRIVCLWSQIMNLKYVLTNLQLNLKEQQMECLMKINEFLIDKTINSNISESTVSEKLNDYCSDDSSIKLTRSLMDIDMIKSDVNELLNWKSFYHSPEVEEITDQCRNVISNNDDFTRWNDCICFAQDRQANKAEYNKNTSEPSLSDLLIQSLNSLKSERQLLGCRDDSYKSNRKIRSNDDINMRFPNTKCCQSDMIIK